MLETLAIADADQRARIFTWTHPLWGSRKSLKAYVSDSEALLAEPWGQRHYRVHLVSDRRGAILSACKAYELDMWALGKIVPAIGFGAVFTPPEERAKGNAARMLRDLMADYARQGFRLATLFSDIDPGYYERLGFSALRSVARQTTAPRLPDPLPRATFRPALGADMGVIDEESRAFARTQALAYYRMPDQAPFLALWYESPSAYILEVDGRPSGYLVGRKRFDRYEVLDGWPSDPILLDEWLGALKALLPSDATLVGWLPEGHGLDHYFDRGRRSSAVWMAAPLRPDAPDIARIVANPHHAWVMDHF